MKTSIFSVACTFALCTIARGAVVVEAEVGGIVNNTVGTAQAVGAASFTTPVPPTVFDPPGWSTASVLGTGDSGSDVDFYSFSTPGGGAMFDMDNTPFLWDTILSLFDSTGTLIAYDDDSFPEDAGTDYGYDAFLGVMTLSPGTYYLAVSQFSNFASATGSYTGFSALARPDGEFGGYAITGTTPGDSSFPISGPDGTLEYTLHMSLEHPGGGISTVPEPSTLIVWSLLAVVGAAAVKLRRSIA